MQDHESKRETNAEMEGKKGEKERGKERVMIG
jgi:hypothetical protein